MFVLLSILLVVALFLIFWGIAASSSEDKKYRNTRTHTPYRGQAYSGLDPYVPPTSYETVHTSYTHHVVVSDAGVTHVDSSSSCDTSSDSSTCDSGSCDSGGGDGGGSDGSCH